jgi:hypothetical protein
MISYHIHSDLAAARRDTLLAEAQASRLAKEARSHRKRTGTHVARSSPLRWLLAWWRSGQSATADARTSGSGRLAMSDAAGGQSGDPAESGYDAGALAQSREVDEPGRLIDTRTG